MLLKQILKKGRLEVQIVKNPFVFIGLIAFTAALLLSVVSEVTKQQIKDNKDLDRMKNILTARFLEDYEEYETKLLDEKEITTLYDKEIVQELYDISTYEQVKDPSLVFSDLVWKENKKDGSLYYYFNADRDKQYLPFFQIKSGGYIIPISGKGLWSTIKGFIYIKPDNEKGKYIVKGISFYEHAETPGLGGEIDKVEVKKRYLNKKIDLNSKKTPKMEKIVKDKDYELGYISGATITSDGLDDFIESHLLERYRPILEKLGEGK